MHLTTRTFKNWREPPKYKQSVLYIQCRTSGILRLYLRYNKPTPHLRAYYNTMKLTSMSQASPKLWGIRDSSFWGFYDKIDPKRNVIYTVRRESSEVIDFTGLWMNAWAQLLFTFPKKNPVSVNFMTCSFCRYLHFACIIEKVVRYERHFPVTITIKLLHNFFIIYAHKNWFVFVSYVLSTLCIFLCT